MSIYRLQQRLLLLMVLSFCQVSQGEDWAQFRGPNASGVSVESKNLPVEFSVDKNVLWKKTLGEGIACPIVVQGRVIATTMADKETFSIRCLNAASGDQYWRCRAAGPSRDRGAHAWSFLNEPSRYDYCAFACQSRCR